MLCSRCDYNNPFEYSLINFTHASLDLPMRLGAEKKHFLDIETKKKRGLIKN